VVAGALLLGAALTALVLIDGSTGPEPGRNERAARPAVPGGVYATPHPQSTQSQPPAPAWPRRPGAALLPGERDSTRRLAPAAALVPAPVAQPPRPDTPAPAPPPAPVEPPTPPDAPAPVPPPVAQPATRPQAQSAAAREFGFER